MASEDKLNEEIIKISTMIFEKYPELINYISEMTDTLPSIKKPEMDNRILKAYYNSLTSLLDNYIREHNT